MSFNKKLPKPKKKKVNEFNTYQSRQLRQRRSAVASSSILKSGLHQPNSIKEHVSKPKKSPNLLLKKKTVSKYKSATDTNISPKSLMSKYDNLGMILKKKKYSKQSILTKKNKKKSRKVSDYSHLYGKNYDISKSLKLDRFSMKVNKKLPKIL